jgi:transcriptional regulator with XRE-family HTH domain
MANTILKMTIFESGKTQLTIAKRAGLSAARLSRIIHGHPPEATPDEKKALAKVLRRSVHELFSEVAA